MTEATQPLLPVTLKERRERLGLTLRDVEEISKGAISNSYLSQLETGKIKSPSLENARILATIYYCQTDDIAEALSLPIPAVPFRCHCCGQSLLHAKFITDTDDGIVSTSDTLARRMGGRFVPVQSHSLPGDDIVEEGYKGGYDFFRNKWIGDQEEMIADMVRCFVPRNLPGDVGTIVDIIAKEVAERDIFEAGGMRAAIERAAATLVNGRDAPETGWLIEHGGGQGPLYWTGESWGKWSGDHRRACRFARREDAFKVSLTLGDLTDHPNGHKVVHHAWGGEPAALTPSPCPGDGMREALQLARDRLADMLMGDDGQAWKEAEKALPIIDAALTPSALSGDAGEGVARKIARDVCDRRNLKRDNGMVYSAALEAAKEALGLSPTHEGGAQ